MNDLLDYAESEARINAEFHITSAETLMRESNTLLAILLSGAGGALALLSSLYEKEAADWLLAGVGTTSGYLFVDAAVLVFMCLKVGPIWPSANEPKNLQPEGFDLDQIRRIELNNKQQCIKLNRERNDKVGFWLNACRFAAVATPLAFISSAALVAAC